MEEKIVPNHDVRVTVIMPVYNAVAWLDMSIGSVVAQTYANWELIAVDDSSTDNSLQVLENWAQKDARVRVFHKENGGPAKARAFGLKESTGDYVFYLDQDDAISEDMFQSCLAAIRANGADAAMPNLIQRGDDGFSKDNFEAFAVDPDSVISGRDAFVRSIDWQGVWAYMLCRADVFKRFACDERYLFGKFNSDELISRLAMLHCGKIAYCTAIYYYSLNPESMSKKLSPRMFGYLETNIHMIEATRQFALPRSVVAKAEVHSFREMIELWHRYLENKAKLSTGERNDIERQFAEFHKALPKANINEMLSGRPGITPQLQRLLMLHDWPLCKMSLSVAWRIGKKNKLYPWFSEEQIKSLK